MGQSHSRFKLRQESIKSHALIFEAKIEIICISDSFSLLLNSDV